jgi:hypothetical protein
LPTGAWPKMPSQRATRCQTGGCALIAGAVGTRRGPIGVSTATHRRHRHPRATRWVRTCMRARIAPTASGAEVRTRAWSHRTISCVPRRTTRSQARPRRRAPTLSVLGCLTSNECRHAPCAWKRATTFASACCSKTATASPVSSSHSQLSLHVTFFFVARGSEWKVTVMCLLGCALVSRRERATPATSHAASIPLTCHTVCGGRALRQQCLLH